MHTAVSEALKRALSGHLNIPDGGILGSARLELSNEIDELLPLAISISVTLFDDTVFGPERAQMVLKHRALLEFIVRLMSAPATQRNAFYSELWEPALVQHIRWSDCVFPDQRSLLKNYALPKFVLFMYAANDLSDGDFDLCNEFLTRPSAQVLSSEQQELLNRVNYGVKPKQIVLELTLQVYGCEMTEDLVVRLQRLLERLEATDQTDPLEFSFKITTLWFGKHVFKMPCNMDIFMGFASMSVICALDEYNNGIYKMPWTYSLEDRPPRVLLAAFVYRSNIG